MSGKLITFEGAEGSGKSTQIEMLRSYLISRQIDVLFLREPGGVAISEKIREILLDRKNQGMDDACEMLLYMAARAQLVAEVILPALQENKVILCDRYLDSTVAYQGYGNGMNLATIDTIGRFATQGVVPDLTIIFDIDAKEGLTRIKREKDRIEQRSLLYHEKVRRGYQELVRKEPERVKLIQVTDTKENIHQQVKVFMDQILDLG